MNIKRKLVGLSMVAMLLGSATIAKADMGYYTSHDFYFKDCNARVFMYVNYLSRIGKDKVSYQCGLYGRDVGDIATTKSSVYTIDKSGVTSKKDTLFSEKLITDAGIYAKATDAKVADAYGIVAKATTDKGTQYVCDRND